MNKVISVATILALTAADNSFLRIKNLFPAREHVAYDNEMVYHKSQDYSKFIENERLLSNPKHPLRSAPLTKLADDELFVDTATDNEMVFYDPHGYGQFIENERLLSDPKRSQRRAPLTKLVDDELFVDTVNDNEMFSSDPQGYRRFIEHEGRLSSRYYPSKVVPVTMFADDELFFETATDNEMVWYPLGEGPKRDPNPWGMFTKSVRDDELFIDTVNDNEMVYNDPQGYGRFIEHEARLSSRYYPSKVVPVTMFADDELFVETATDNEMVYYSPGSAQKYPVYPSGMMTDSVRPNRQQIIRLDPREKYGFNNYDDDELFKAEKIEGKIHEGIKKTKDSISQHPESVKQALGVLKKLPHGKKNSAQGSNDLSALGQLIKEGRTVHNEGKAHRTQKKSEVHDHNLNFIEDVQDNNLSIKEFLDQAKLKAKGPFKLAEGHPQVISEGTKVIKAL